MTRVALVILVAAAVAPVPAQVVAPFAASGDRCRAAVALPSLDLSLDMADVMPEVATAGGLAPAPMPNLCRETLAVLPEGVRFRLDPLPPSVRDNRQLLRDQELDRLRHRLVLPHELLQMRASGRDRERHRHPSFERRLHLPQVAAPGERP